MIDALISLVYVKNTNIIKSKNNIEITTYLLQLVFMSRNITNLGYTNNYVDKIWLVLKKSSMLKIKSKVNIA